MPRIYDPGYLDLVAKLLQLRESPGALSDMIEEGIQPVLVINPLLTNYVSQAVVLSAKAVGKGTLKVVQPASPAAGADWSFGVPAGVRWTIKALRASFTTGVTAGNRFPSFIFRPVFAGLGDFMYKVAVRAAVVALNGSQIITCQFGQPVETVEPSGGTQAILMAAPLPVELNGGDSILSNTLGILPVDQWASIFLFVEEWPTP